MGFRSRCPPSYEDALRRGSCERERGYPSMSRKLSRSFANWGRSAASVPPCAEARTYFAPSTAQRTFVLCMTDMGDLVFLPPLIRRLRKLAPSCTLRSVQVPLEQIEGMLSSGDADSRSAQSMQRLKASSSNSYSCILRADN